jgi:hypothetical protein
MVEFVEEVLVVQTLRAKAYCELATALAANDTATIQTTTDTFRELSGRVRAVINECSDDKLRVMLRKMQEDEADKLRLTVEIHALKGSQIHEEEDFSVGDEHACGCGMRVGPTKHDVVEALKEAYVAMELCVQSILECMEELREMKCDSM